MLQPNELTIRLSPKAGDLTVQSFLGAVQEIVQLLRGIEVNFTGGQGNLWIGAL